MKPSLSKILALAAAIGIAFFSATSCKKISGTNPKSTDSLPTAIIDSSAGCAFYPNIPVRFYPSSTNVPGGTTFHWDFGDGGTSTDEFPVHTYTVSGTYSVTLAFNNSLNLIHKSIYVTPVSGSHYTQLMSGTRRWIGSANGVTETLYGTVDTPLVVQVVDSGIIKFLYGNAPMYLSDIDTIVKNCITYTDCSGKRFMRYYYLQDSMAYFYSGWYPNIVGHDYPIISIHTK